MTAIRHLWAHHRAAFVFFIASVALTLFFLIRLAVFAHYWSDPAHRNLSPQPWMPLGYVARSWGRTPEALAAALDTSAGRRDTLRDIARARGVPVETVIAELNALLVAGPSQ